MRDKVAPKKEVDALLAEGAKRLGVPLSTGRLSALLFYLAELKRWNEKINLTGLREDQEIVVKHFLDSLTPLSI
ncbi:MAG TPA: RsmG family class I SAM-dependent methyltransferase, partial [Candidatus Manganitrophaceae bacterium]|nr:RsmG family class I SAM-dependent methyltransferase [Candidatus Manganitrophaceae bacterium]